MEVVAAAPGAGPVPPYQRRDVEEWSRLDQLTGMLEHARVEKDHWAANTHNSTHQYGKVVDSRTGSAADGKIHQRQQRQLEVFRSQGPGTACLQVIRTQVSSSSRWSSNQNRVHSQRNAHFDNLHLALNPLDLSSQKTKASVGRSGSLGGRRPPTRSSRPSIRDRQNGDGSVADHFDIESTTSNDKDDKEYEKIINQNGVDSQTPSPVEYQSLVNEQIKNKNNQEELDSWRKNTRNLLQLNQQTRTLIENSLADSKSRTHAIKQDTGTDRRLNAALRGNNVDLEALDQILKSISPESSGTYSDTASINEEPKLASDDSADQVSSDRKTSKTKRHSFITVESLKEVRGRLRRRSSPIDDYYGGGGNGSGNDQRRDEELDDGIVSEDNVVMRRETAAMPVANVGVSRVRSYVYGMETMLGSIRKPVGGTGSLESRTSGKPNGTTGNRSEDWYNRRKSYGFEQVHNQQIDQSNTISLHARNKIESSTDSGICRSTEIVLVPSAVKSAQMLTNNLNNNSDIDKSDFNYEQGDMNCHKQSLKFYNKNVNSTIINVGSDFSKNQLNSYQKTHTKNDSFNKKEDHNELISIWNRRASLNNSNNNKDKNNLTNKESEQTTITIPITSEVSSVNSINRKLYHRQFSENSSLSIEQMNDNTDMKRHSIAVDESKYVNRNSDNKYPFEHLRRTSLVIGDAKNDAFNAFTYEGGDEDNNIHNRKTKKVEFCKTEVHFAAESGRVNIVETDEKPPPTNNFRRRRRNSGITNNQTGDDINKNGLPVIHFGDTSYEKQLFSVPDHDNIQIEDVSDTFQQESPVDNFISNSTVTVSSVPISTEVLPKDFMDCENQPRGILKNKMTKPRPYLLGDNDDLPARDTNSDDQEHNNKIWGVRLRPVQKEDSPMWKSTVTVQNTAYSVPVVVDNNQANDTFTCKENVDANQSTNSDLGSCKSEFQKMLNSLQPVRKPSLTGEGPFRQHQPIAVDLRRSSWSVADRVKQVENFHWTENKGYSTRVNFGGGEATVIENIDSIKSDTQSLWPAREENHKNDEKKHSSILNKGLVVRIGRDDSNHTVCSKTTTDHESNNTTTTTKITIDMSPSPSDSQYPTFSSIKLPRASLHSLKSTSLIIASESIAKERARGRSAIPDQLAALRRLYDEASEHSDDSERADEEVRSYMSGGGDESDLREEEATSVVSGSWSKMRAFRAIKQQLNNANLQRQTAASKQNEIIKNIINHQSYFKRDFASTKTSSIYNKEKSQLDKITNNINNVRQPMIKQQLSSNSSKTNSIRKVKETQSLNISQTDKKQSISASKFELKTDNLSSPMLVGSSIQKVVKTTLNSTQKSKEEIYTNSTKDNYNNTILATSYVRNLPNSQKKNNIKKPVSNHYIRSISPVSRREVPSTKRNDFYHNAIRSPKLAKKYIDKPREEIRKENKPDLIKHHMESREYVNLSSVFNVERNTTKDSTNKTKSAEVRKVTPIIANRPESPVYENIDEVINSQPSGTEHESSIIQELTRAADQILQAVNGYTDDDSIKLSTDEEDDKKNIFKDYRQNSDLLETIAESQSWKQSQTEMKKHSEASKCKIRSYKPTSSTSSLDSVNKEHKPVVPVRPNRCEKLREERAKKKLNTNNSEISKVTKARRLQRASSREALLQSHGSSSEDLPQNVEVIRKPRVTRRIKNPSTASETSKKTSVPQTNSAKRRECEIRRVPDRVPVVGLQEIRHKTAISTIRSTAEKAASRDKIVKGKSEDLRKKNTNKSSFLRGSSAKCLGDGAVRAPSSRGTGSTVSAIRTSSGVALKKVAA